jgi:hypothetical protein
MKEAKFYKFAGNTIYGMITSIKVRVEDEERICSDLCGIGIQ